MFKDILRHTTAWESENTSAILKLMMPTQDDAMRARRAFDAKNQRDVGHSDPIWIQFGSIDSIDAAFACHLKLSS